MKRRVLKFLASRELSTYIIIVAGIYYIFLFAWGLTSPGKAVMNISKTLPFIFLYLLFFINLILCIIDRLPVIIRRLSENPVFLKAGDELKVIANDLNELEHIFKKRYRILKRDVDNILFVKGKYGAIAEIIFHLSFIFILTGVLLSIITHFEGKAVVVEGYSFWGEFSDYIEKPPEDIFYKRAPDISFRVNRVEAEFWEDKLFFTDLFAEMLYPADTGKNKKILRLRSGMWNKGVFVNIQGMGYAPVFLIKDKRGKILDSRTLSLNVFPPPTEDSFLIPELPYRVYLKFYPDAVINGNKIEPGVMWIKNPVYSIRVMRGKRPVFSGILKLGEEAIFDGYALSFPDVKKWAQIRVTKDYGIPVVIFGFFLIFIASFWIVLFYRREVEIRKSKDSVKIICGAQFFANLHREILIRELEKRGLKVL